MAKLKGTTAKWDVHTIRDGVEIKIKKLPFSATRELMERSETLREGDPESIEFIQTMLLKYTDIGEEEGYDPFGTDEDALTLDECTELFSALMGKAKKKETGQLGN